ncbi:unnamed protein product [Ixodes hexagonus]
MNRYSWNKAILLNMNSRMFRILQVANVLFLEAPAGVGFSYDESGRYRTNDDQTADDNYLAVQDFFSKYPHLKKNDFYVAGESYTGIYVPMLTLRILRDPKGIRLKGYAVGNGYLDDSLLLNSLVFFGYYHGLYGVNFWNRLTANCCNGSVSQHSCTFTTHPPSKCSKAVIEAKLVIYAQGLNIYNLYAPCVNVGASSVHFPGQGPRGTSRMDRSRELMFKGSNQTLPATNLRLGLSCFDDEPLNRYFNRHDVKVAIHVEKSHMPWVPCADVLNYTRQYKSMRTVVKELVDSGHLRALIYNGDVDMACNFLGDEWFVNGLGYAVSSILLPKSSRSSGSGHLVPTDKPAEAFQMINNFLTGTPFAATENKI